MISKPDTGLSGSVGGTVWQTHAITIGEEELLCEGYLLKIRGAMKNRRRHFRLTTHQLSFYTRDAGEIIASVNLSDVSAVTDVSKTRMRVITKEPFGAGNQVCPGFCFAPSALLGMSSPGVLL